MRKILHRFALEQQGDAELCTPEVTLLGPEAQLEPSAQPGIQRVVPTPADDVPDVLCIVLEDGSEWHVSLEELRGVLAGIENARTLCMCERCGGNGLRTIYSADYTSWHQVLCEACEGKGVKLCN